MATLVNKMNGEVKVIIPNMREFRVFYSDSEGSVMFFKRDWTKEATNQEEHWKPSEEQMEALRSTLDFMPDTFKPKCTLMTLQHDLNKLTDK